MPRFYRRRRTFSRRRRRRALGRFRRRFKRKRRRTKFSLRTKYVRATMPPYKLVKFRHTRNVDYSSSSTVPNVLTYGKQYRLNSIFDPDFDLGGKSVLGWNEWNDFYARYQVYGVSLFIRCTNVHATHKFYVAIVPTDNNNGTDPPTGVFSVGDRPYAKLLHVAPAGNAQCVQTAYHYFDLRRMQGITLAEFQQRTLYGADMNANPGKTQNLQIGVATNTGTINDIRIDLTFTYYVRLMDRKGLSTPLG